MSNEQKSQNKDTPEGTLTPISKQQVHILVTETDMCKFEISRMSDFMGSYAQLQMSLLTKNFTEGIISNLPIADMGIVNDVLQHAKAVTKGGISLIPDFDHLPSDIREKLKKGIYTISDSKQVDGNLRAVICDENHVRVKDITLKKIANDPGTIEMTRSIFNQLQMKQINDRLTAIQEIQSYQLDKDRDHAIFTPFFSARDYIRCAQDAETWEDRNEYLKKAADKLTESKNGVYTEMHTAINHLAKYSKWSIFHKQSTISTLTSHVADDLQLLAKICGIKMQVYEYLGQPKNVTSEMKQYRTNMLDFLTKEVENTGYTAIELLHDNFKYNRDNLDCWLTFSKDFQSKIADSLPELSAKETYIISLEDAENG